MLFNSCRNVTYSHLHVFDKWNEIINLDFALRQANAALAHLHFLVTIFGHILPLGQYLGEIVRIGHH